jgi:hypothetical protein
MRELITEKIDVTSFDRVVKKLELMVSKLQKDVNKIQTGQVVRLSPRVGEPVAAGDERPTTSLVITHSSLPLAGPIGLKALRLQSEHARDERVRARTHVKKLVHPN